MNQSDLLLQSAIYSLNRIGHFEEADAIEDLILSHEHCKIPGNVSEADFVKWQADRDRLLLRIRDLEYALHAARGFMKDVLVDRTVDSVSNPVPWHPV